MGIRGVGKSCNYNDMRTYNRTNSADGYYKKSGRTKEIQEGYLGKRTQLKNKQREIFAKKIAKQELRRNVKETSLSDKSRIEKIINAYKANFLYKQ